MDAIRKSPIVISGIVVAVAMAAPVRAEDLSQAWQIALAVNQQLQADSVAAVVNGAVRASRAPTIQPFTLNTSFSTAPSATCDRPGGRDGG
jgi:hypothetical protein